MRISGYGRAGGCKLSRLSLRPTVASRGRRTCTQPLHALLEYRPLRRRTMSCVEIRSRVVLFPSGAIL